MINFAIYFLELVSVILIIHVVFQTRLCINYAVIVSFVLSLGMMYLTNIIKVPYISYVAHLIVFIYCICEFRRSWWETFLRFACSIALGAILETILLMEVSSWTQTLEHSQFVYLGISTGMLICAMLLYWIFVHKKTSFIIDMGDKTFIVLVIVINVFVLYVKNEGNGRYLRLLVCVISFIVLIVRFMVIMKKGNKKIQAEESKWLLQYSEQYEELIQEVRKRQHNYKNEIQSIKIACSVGNGETVAMDVIREYEYADQYTGVLNGCENPVIAGLIYSKIRDFEEQGVATASRICMRNVGLALELREVIDIIGILLDNAFECTKEQKMRTMQLDIKEMDNGVLFQTRNPSPYIATTEISNMFTLGYSTKGKNRGIGLHTVRELMRKCRGDIITGNRTVDEINYFEIQVIVPYKNKHVSKN